MKKQRFIMVFTIVFFLINFAVLAKEKIVVLADENYQPYSFIEKNELKGIYVEILKEIGKNLKNYEISLEPIPWVRGLKMIENGEVYAIIPPYFRPVERPYMYYSEPILQEELVLVGLSKLNKKWPQDFKGNKIGINRGYSIFNDAEKKIIKIEEANSTEDNIQKLLTGRIDFYTNDKYSILWALENLKKSKLVPSETLVKVHEIVVLRKDWSYIGYSKFYNFSKKQEFESLVNIEIEKMKKNGKIDEIIKRYIGK